VLRLFLDHLLPVFLAAGTGYLMAARLGVSPRPLARVAFYLFSPCLVFRIMAENHVSGEALARMSGFGAAVLLVQAGLAFAAARVLRLSRERTSALVLVAFLPNAGNYGLSVNLFAFGPEGLSQAGLFFVVSAVVSYTAGVFVASLGRTSPGRALAGLFRVPTIWAVLLGFVLMELDATLPFPLTRTVNVLADACIPVFLVVLGMQLVGAEIRDRAGHLVLALGLRMGGGLLLGLLAAPLFGLTGAARQAGLLQAAMPSAVICTILASEYDVEPRFVTSAVFLSTLVSPLVLTPLLSYLGAR
jgi:hypothetical protein